MSNQNTVETIDDVLAILCNGSNTQSGYQFEPGDFSVLSGMHRQLNNGTALTDRQHELLRSKLSRPIYVSQFDKINIRPVEYFIALKKTREPTREIPRKARISLTGRPDILTSARAKHQENEIWIKVEYPFNKTNGELVNECIREASNHVYDRQAKENFFEFDDLTVYNLVSKLGDNDFDIDEEIIEYYNKLAKIKNNPEDYLARVMAGQLLNCHPSTEKHLLEKFGTPSVDNILQYADSSLLYDFSYIDQDLLEQAVENTNPLVKRLVNRNSTQVLVSPNNYEFADVAEAVSQLKRWPILCILDSDDALEHLKNNYKTFEKYVDSSEVSVLFRLDNATNAKFNEYIKQQGLNNQVTENTKIVYISKDKLPKPLLNTNWRPSLVIHANGSSRIQRKIENWIYDVDLIIHYDTTKTFFQRSFGVFNTDYAGSRLANTRSIQEI